METIVLSSSNSFVNKNLVEPPSEHEVIETDLIPYVGMEFETQEHAYGSYNVYASFTSFSIRKDCVNKSKVDQSIVLS